MRPRKGGPFYGRPGNARSRTGRALLWLYLTGAAILFGGELNAVIENAAAEAGDPGAKRRGETRLGDKEGPAASEPQAERQAA